MNPLGASNSKKLGTTAAVLLLLFVTALPATAACCVGNPGNVAAMHAAMPCCAEGCTMSSPNSSRDNDVTVASSPSPGIGASPGFALAFLATAATVTIVSKATERTSNELFAPPPFLIHAQFRI